MLLYHFTSERAAELIRQSGELRPDLHNILDRNLLWLTDEPAPKESWLFGPVNPRFRSSHASRIAQRFEVDTDEAVPWAAIRDQFQEWQIRALESARGARPGSWYVCALVVGTLWVTQTALALAGVHVG